MGVAVKIYNVVRLDFFVRAQPKFWFGRPACFHLLGKESISQPRKKLDSPILIEKNASRHRPEKFTDRDLKKDHRVTPIEHFQIDISQILFRD